ncbi:MAG: oxidoreductase, partial [Plesiomonas shigelloides]
MTQLNAMPQFSISTCTPWTEQRHTFSGPKLSQVLAQAGIYNQRIEIQAINGYQITLSPADLSPYAPILATEIDGKPMRIRDKGPLWL